MRRVSEELALDLPGKVPSFIDEIVDELGDYSLSCNPSSELDALILFGVQRIVYYQLAAYRKLCAIARGRKSSIAVDLLEDSLSEIVYAEEMFSAILDNEVHPMEHPEVLEEPVARAPIRLALVSSR
jgi:hypothetical protein